MIFQHYQPPFCKAFYYFNSFLLLATRIYASNIASLSRVKAIPVLKNPLARLLHISGWASLVSGTQEKAQHRTSLGQLRLDPGVNPLAKSLALTFTYCAAWGK